MSFNIHLNNYLKLRHWMLEREYMRVNRMTGKTPLTSDPVMAEWRWCNVNRCYDRETMWIHKHIVKAHEKNDLVWFNLVIARFINWHPTLADIGFTTDWRPDSFCSVIRRRMDAGEKVYTGAYMIRAGTGEDALLTKEAYLCRRVFTPLWERRSEAPLDSQCCAEWDHFFKQTFGMGEFMRNQVITDMKYTHLLDPMLTPDWTTFCLLGPGSLRGLNRVLGRDKDTSFEAGEAHEHLLNLRHYVREDLEDIGQEESRYMGDIELMRVISDILWYLDDLNNLSNCLCEYDKYMRIINGEGKPRSRYTPSYKPLPF